MIELSSGKCQHFLQQLQEVTLGFQHSQSDGARAEAVKFLRQLSADMPEYYGLVRDAFALAKRKVALRFQQGTSFYNTFPWSMCSLLGFVLQPRGNKRKRAIERSQALAAEILRQWDAGVLPGDTFASRFFEGDLLRGLTSWSTTDAAMDSGLLKELFSYGVSLTVMQRLESRHHLVNLHTVPSRASSATAISAFLRRKLNPDIHEANFRSNFERYLGMFDQLVEEEWGSMSELQKLISGHNLSVMFRDTSATEAMIEAAAPPKALSGSSMLEFQAHLKATLADGGHYAFPSEIAADGSTQYMLVHFVSSKPESKKYMEKVTRWGEDLWREQAWFR